MAYNLYHRDTDKPPAVTTQDRQTTPTLVLRLAVEMVRYYDHTIILEYPNGNKQPITPEDVESRFS
jgi:hypothetical protein